LHAYLQLVSARGPLTVDVTAQDFDDHGAALRIDPRIEAAAYRITQKRSPTWSGTRPDYFPPVLALCREGAQVSGILREPAAGARRP